MRKPYTRWLSAPWRHMNVLFWPVEAFKEGVLTVLRCERAYFSALSESLHGASSPLEEVRLNLMKEIALARGLYPEWVFARGFNVDLRASYRYFLLTLDRVHDAIFAAHEVLMQQVEPEILSHFLPELQLIIRHHLALVEVLIVFFETGAWVDLSSTNGDISSLEQRLQASHPHLLLWVRDQADIRDSLLQLIMTLPTNQPKETLC
ncbi:MAG TPA: hypothetical protein VFU82_06610 [Gammaproteobacteria bacterium]|nr:hypothetical protein [Gammaproteobacteria bacterium]